MIIPLLNIEIKKLKKRKTARERCDCRGINREFVEKKKMATEVLKKEVIGRAAEDSEAHFNRDTGVLTLFDGKGRELFCISVNGWISSGYRADGDGGWIKFQKAKGGD